MLRERSSGAESVGPKAVLTTTQGLGRFGADAAGPCFPGVSMPTKGPGVSFRSLLSLVMQMAEEKWLRAWVGARGPGLESKLRLFLVLGF